MFWKEWLWLFLLSYWQCLQILLCWSFSPSIAVDFYSTVVSAYSVVDFFYTVVLCSQLFLYINSILILFLISEVSLFYCLCINLTVDSFLLSIFAQLENLSTNLFDWFYIQSRETFWWLFLTALTVFKFYSFVNILYNGVECFYIIFDSLYTDFTMPDRVEILKLFIL